MGWNWELGAGGKQAETPRPPYNTKPSSGNGPLQTVRQPSLKLGVYFLGLNLIQSAVGIILSRFKVGTCFPLSCFPLSFPTCYRNGGGVRPRPAGASAVVVEGSQGWMHATMAAGHTSFCEADKDWIRANCVEELVDTPVWQAAT